MSFSLASDCRALWQGRALLWVMTRREVSARYAGTAVGVLWAYIQPMLTVAAFYLVFDVVLSMRMAAGAGSAVAAEFGEQPRTFGAGVFLLVGMLPWMAFCDAIARGMNSLVEAGSLLQKNPLPPVLFPVRAVLASSVVFGPLLILVAMLYVWGHGVGWPALALLPLWLGQLLLSVVLAYLLAILAAALRDVAQLVGFLLAVGVYVSPILFPMSMFPQGWGWVLWLNPMAAFVLGYQAVLLQGQWPSVQVWAVVGVWLALLLPLLALLVGRSRDQLADWL